MEITDSDDEVILTVSYDKKDFFRFSFISEYLYTGVLLKFIPLYLIMTALAALSIFSYKNYYGGGFVLFIMVLVPLYMTFRFRRSVARDYNEYYKNGITYVFNKIGIQGSVFGEMSFINYEDIFKVISGRDAFYVYINSFMCFYLPYKSMDDAAYTKLNGLFDGISNPAVSE